MVKFFLVLHFFLMGLFMAGCSKDNGPTKPVVVPETSVDEQGTARIATNSEGKAIIHTDLLDRIEFSITNESGSGLDSIVIDYFEETARCIIEASDPGGLYAGFFFWGDYSTYRSFQAGTGRHAPVELKTDAAGVTMEIALVSLSEISKDRSPYEAHVACQEIDPFAASAGIRYQYEQKDVMQMCGQIVEYIKGLADYNTALLSIGLIDEDTWPGGDLSTARALKIDKAELLSFTSEQASEYILAWLEEKKKTGWGRIDAATQFMLQEIRTEYQKQDGYVALFGLDLRIYGGAPEAPRLYWPADSASVNEDALFFVWSDVPAAAYYEIEFQSRQEFPPVIITYDHLTATQFMLPEPLDVQTWYWRVRATDGQGNTGEWSDERSVVVVAGSSALIDIDGNIYRTVAIGSQVWMAENLKVLHYRNGDPVERVTDNTEWVALDQGAYCDYNNDTSRVSTYGRLYNWYATRDARGLAPEGWHVPSEQEWQMLIDYLGGPAEAGGKMKETGTSHWATGGWSSNESGFTALPGGYRYSIDGNFSDLELHAYFWSSTELDPDYAWRQRLFYNSSDIYSGYSHKTYGFSVRCVKN